MSPGMFAVVAGEPLDSAGTCQPDIQALFRTPVLLGIGILVYIESSCRAKRFHQHYTVERRSTINSVL